MRIEARPLRILAVEAFLDATRRRIVPAVVVISFLTLLMVDSCATCSANIAVSGAEGEAARLSVLNWTGMAAFGALALWSIALAGLLAADHLRSIFEDGSALLLLSRPVSRPTIAAARLAGSLAVSVPAALILCVGATFFLVIRGGLPVGPAIVATSATLASIVVVAALAMTASLFLPRIVTVLLVIGGVGLIGVVNVTSASGNELSGLYWLLDRFGPPLMSSIVLGLSPWSGQVIQSISTLDVVLRALIWLFAAVALLLVVFDQRDLTRLEPR